MELINDGIVDKARKSSGSNSKAIANRREGKHDVQVPLDFGNKKVYTRLAGVGYSCRFRLICNRPKYVMNILFRKEVWNSTAGNDSIEVYVDNFRVSNEEHSGVTSYSR